MSLRGGGGAPRRGNLISALFVYQMRFLRSLCSLGMTDLSAGATIVSPPTGEMPEKWDFSMGYARFSSIRSASWRIRAAIQAVSMIRSTCSTRCRAPGTGS